MLVEYENCIRNTRQYFLGFSWRWWQYLDVLSKFLKLTYHMRCYNSSVIRDNHNDKTEFDDPSFKFVSYFTRAKQISLISLGNHAFVRDLFIFILIRWYKKLLLRELSVKLSICMKRHLLQVLLNFSWLGFMVNKIIL